MNVTRILEFDAAHRVMNHESKCATLHGHRYKVEITAKADELDLIGRVVDFSVLKARVGGWIDLHWDHTTIIFHEDEKTLAGLATVPGFKPIYVADWNPTAENMAWHLLHVVCPLILDDLPITVVRVVVHETPNCSAEVSLG